MQPDEISGTCPPCIYTLSHVSGCSKAISPVWGVNEAISLIAQPKSRAFIVRESA